MARLVVFAIFAASLPLVMSIRKHLAAGHFFCVMTAAGKNWAILAV
jgi:hypothetical protein